MKGFPSVIRIIDRTLKNIEREGGSNESISSDYYDRNFMFRRIIFF